MVLAYPNRVLSRDQLMDLTVGREADPLDRSIDVQVSRLRQRLGDDGRETALIKFVRDLEELERMVQLTLDYMRGLDDGEAVHPVDVDALLSAMVDDEAVGGTPGQLDIAVLDRGPGIPAEALEQVFEPFRRLEASRHPDTGGTGLGLSIARNIAQSMGGDVTLVNRPGGGLEARLRLPRR